MRAMFLREFRTKGTMFYQRLQGAYKQAFEGYFTRNLKKMEKLETALHERLAVALKGQDPADIEALSKALTNADDGVLRKGLGDDILRKGGPTQYFGPQVTSSGKVGKSAVEESIDESLGNIRGLLGGLAEKGDPNALAGLQILNQMEKNIYVNFCDTFI